MRNLAFVRVLVASAFILSAFPAQARITVFDAGTHFTAGGYCTPGQVGGSDCAAQALPFQITLGGQTYDSFILNGNGTLTLGTAGIDWNSVSGSSPDLASYPMPVFSPNNDNQIFLRTLMDPDGTEADTRWAASVTTVPGTSLSAYWFPCSTAILCGKDSLAAELSDEVPSFHTVDEIRALQQYGMFGLTLTSLGADSFQLDYFYNTNVDPIATYGFNAPGGPSLQTTGPLVNQSWIFDAAGVRAVPEPATWMLFLLGFGAIGSVLRRERRRELSRA